MLVVSTALLGCNLRPGERERARVGRASSEHTLTPPRDPELEARLTGILEQMKGLEGVRVNPAGGEGRVLRLGRPDEVNFRNAESRAKRAVIEALREHGTPPSAMTFIVRPQADGSQELRAGEVSSTTQVRPPPPVEEEESAELVDQAFLDRQFEKARNTRTERDLLDENGGRGSRPHA